MASSSCTFDPISAIEELHAAVRDWTLHIPQNLPYVDLMFAFGFATLGDRARAETLVESARKVMEVAIPAHETQRVAEKQAAPFVAAEVTNFLFKAFKYRVDQALAGKPHAGALSIELLNELKEFKMRAREGYLNRFNLVHFVIASMRARSFILEPFESPDPYKELSKERKGTQPPELQDVHDAGDLAAGIKQLLKDPLPGRPAWEARVLVLREALPLAPRVGHELTLELLALIPPALHQIPAAGFGDDPHYLHLKQGELLTLGVSLAAHYRDPGLITKLLNCFIELLQGKAETHSVRLINSVAPACLLALKKLGARAEVERYVKLIEAHLQAGSLSADMRPSNSNELERWAKENQALAHLAACYLALGQDDLAKPLLDSGRDELLTSQASRLNCRNYVDFARAHIAAYGFSRGDIGLTRIVELFREMPRGIISNTFTTAPCYSRFHLLLVEEAVLAVCRMDFATPHHVSA